MIYPYGIMSFALFQIFNFFSDPIYALTIYKCFLHPFKIDKKKFVKLRIYYFNQVFRER
jgi:hypothetical protein